MISFKSFLLEKDYSFSDVSEKGQWVDIPIEVFDKEHTINKELYDLISKSYSYVGGHSNYTKPDDLPLGAFPDPEDSIFWYGIDFDEDPEPDVLKVVKKTEFGNKSVVGATDGSDKAKKEYVRSVVEFLSKSGNYAEVSGAIAHVLMTRYSVKAIESKKIVEKVLNKKITWYGQHPEGKYDNYKGFYERKINEKPYIKILLGRPNIPS
jgi:hypothetical protein